MTPKKNIPPQTITAPALVIAPTDRPAQVGDVNVAPTTTAAEDLLTHSQRRVNLIWEAMQAFIAAATVSSALYVSSRLALLILVPTATEKQTSMANTSFMLISNLVSLIIGFYFGRTNHQRTGGVKQGEEGR